MRWSVTLGRVFGVKIRIHASFVLILAWFAWEGWRLGGWNAAAWSLLLIICLFACVVLHELGHSLVAMRFGSGVHSITLLPIGGVAALTSVPEKPHQELLMSIAGPLVNLLLATVIATARGGWPGWLDAPLVPGNAGELADSLVRANIVLAVFNLLPAFPMDGGRILRSLLATFLCHARATAVAAGLGQVVAVGFIILGAMGNPFLVVIGLFVLLGAESEERLARIKSRLAQVTAGDVMATALAVLGPEDRLVDRLDRLYHSSQNQFPVLAGDTLVGLLSRQAWLDGIRRRGEGVRAAEVMRRQMLVLKPDCPLLTIHRDLWSLRADAFPVVDGTRLVGLLSVEDVNRYLAIQQARELAGAGGPRGGRSRFAVDLG